MINIFAGKLSKTGIGFVFYNGSSEGINSISTAVTIFLFNTSLMSIAGADGVAGFTAINYVGTLGIMLLFGVSDGIGPIISYNFALPMFLGVNGIWLSVPFAEACTIVIALLLLRKTNKKMTNTMTETANKKEAVKNNKGFIYS